MRTSSHLLLILWFISYQFGTIHVRGDTKFYYISKDRKSDLHVCIAPKVGTTSLFTALYEVIMDKPIDGKAHFRPQVWEKWSEGKNSSLSAYPHSGVEKRISMRIVRDPIDRYISAFHSKVACCENMPRKGCMKDKVSNPNEFSTYFTEKLGYPGEVCLYFSEYVKALHTFKERDAELELDPHFMPQSKYCAQNTSHVLLQGNLDDCIASLRTLREFDFQNLKDLKLHVSKKSKTTRPWSFGDADSKRLCQVAKTDYDALGLPIPERCRVLGIS